MHVPQTEITIRGPDGAVLLQKTVPPGDYVLGRAEECDLSFAADLVSRRHAQLTMAFERNERYSSVEELQADITAYQNGFATQAENAGLSKQIVLALKRHKAVATSIAAALVILAAVLAVAFLRVTGEKNRAERALADLQRTAPTLIDEGRKLIDTQQFDDALAKISFAVTIEPKNAEYRLLRAQLLQAMLRMDEAAAEFHRVLELAPPAPIADSARANAALCEKLLHDYRNPADFDSPAWQALYAQMNEEGRTTQAAPIAAKLGLSKNAAEALLKARLVEWRKLPGWSAKPENERLNWQKDGTLEADFENVPIDSAATFRGLPLSVANLSSTHVSDLSPLHGMLLRILNLTGIKPLPSLAPLAGMPLEDFYISDLEPGSDLSPLKGMQLRSFGGGGSQYSDYAVLRGMPLTNLAVSGSSIASLADFAGAPLVELRANVCRQLTDISAVRTMKLKTILLNDCSSLADFSPLLDCPELEYATVPRDNKAIEVLRRHPHLQALSYDTGHKIPAAQFWAEFDAKWKAAAADADAVTKIRAAFAAAGLPPPGEDNLQRGSGGTFQINLNSWGSKVTALPNLRGLPVIIFMATDVRVKSFAPLVSSQLRELHIWGAPDVDLAPLRECPQLQVLHLSSRPSLHDISALAGMHLHALWLYRTSVADLSPLAGMPLERLVVNFTNVSELSPLQKCPQLDSLEADDAHLLRDLSPLTGMQLHTLAISGTAVKDLSPLAGMPLRTFRFARTQITDIGPLLKCQDLENLVVPEDLPHLTDLRALPHLQRISTKWDDSQNVPAQSASEFWKEYDAKHPAK